MELRRDPFLPALSGPPLRPWLVALALLVCQPAAGQVVREPAEPLPELVDSADARSQARRQQGRFELQRKRYLPMAYELGGGRCDETVGRFCSWYDEGEWSPEPERPEIVEMRDQLIAFLDSIQRLVPGDGWVLGQRVWYRSEGGDWEGANRVARACGGVQPWWCAALEGFSLHGAGRFEAAERRFEAALRGMDPEEARKWRIPRRAVPSDTRGLLDDTPDSTLTEVLGRLWRLADPLLLVPGNDRLTAHYSRWAVALMRAEARNPFQISWGRDLEELTIRHGWEVGWERRQAPSYNLRDNVVGHKHPEGRDYMPSRRAVEDLSETRPEDVRADRQGPRSLYAPAYAPVLLPMVGQVAAFPRGDRLTVVATHFVPADTTWHAAHGHARPWMEPGDQAELPDEAGLFLVAGDGRVREQRSEVGSGVRMLEVPAGRYFASVEAWSPSRRLAGRHRVGIRRDTVPSDVPTLSDLLLVEPEAGDPGSVEEAAAGALPTLTLSRGRPFGVVWEMNGLCWRPETVQYELSVERTGRGLFRRLGEGLGLVGPERPLSLNWQEPGPDRPMPVLRRLSLELPPLEPGRYEVVLKATGQGRGALVSRLEFAVSDGRYVDENPRPF